MVGAVERRKIGTTRVEGSSLVQFLRLSLFHLAIPPYGGGSRIRTYNLLVTSVRLRGVKMAALREWREVVFQFSD